MRVKISCNEGARMRSSGWSGWETKVIMIANRGFSGTYCSYMQRDYASELSLELSKPVAIKEGEGNSACEPGKTA